jgi:TP901 family phage tail tape measure protein
MRSAQVFTGEMSKSTAQLRSTMRLYKAELRATTARMDDAKNSTEALRAKSDSYSKQLIVQRQILNNLSDQHRRVAQAEGENSKEAMRLATAVQRAKAEEARIERQLKTTNKAITDQSSSWRRLRSEYDKAKADAAPPTSFDAMRGAGMAVTGVGIGATAGIAGTVKVAADFESAMSRVGALSGATDAELQKMNKTAQELGSSTAFSATQAAEGMQFLSMAGFNASETIAAMPGMLDMAAAGQVELGRAADISSNILSAFGLEASEMRRVGDVLTKAFTSSNVNLEMLGNTMQYVGPIAKAAGFSLEEVSAAAGLLGNAGIQGEKAGTALRSVITRLADPPKEASDAMDKLGLQITDSNGKMLPMANILGQAEEGMKGMTNAQRTAIASQLAGTEAASAFLALMDTGPDRLKDFTGELENSGGTARRVAKEQLDNLNGSLTELKSASEGAAISIGSTLSPYIRQAAEFIKGLVNRFNNLSPEMKKAIAITAAVAAGVALIGGPVLLLIGLLPTIAAGFSTLVGIFGAFNTVMLANPIGLVIVAITALIAAGVLLYKNWDKVKSSASSLWEGIKNAFKKGVNVAIGWLNTLIDKINMIPGITIPKVEKLDIKNLSTSYNPMAHGHASGLPYVPYDNYPALLHRGESVLTRAEADNHRKEGTGKVIKIANLNINGMNKTVKEIFDEIMDIAEREEFNTGEVV